MFYSCKFVCVCVVGSLMFLRSMDLGLMQINMLCYVKCYVAVEKINE